MSAISYGEIKKKYSDQFSIFYELQYLGSQKDLLTLTTSWMDEASLIAISKTCRFFYHFLKTNREQIKEDYLPLIETKVFANLKEISDIPTIVFPLTKTLDSIRPEELIFPLTKIELISDESISSQSSSLRRTKFIAFRYNITLSTTDTVIDKAIEIIGKNLHIVIDERHPVRKHSFLEKWEIKRLKNLIKKEVVGENLEIFSILGFRTHYEGDNHCKLID